MTALKAGDKAPDFNAIASNGKDVSLSSLKGKKVILYFYPKDSTPGCTAEACNLRDNYNLWINKGYEVIGVSADSDASHQRFAEKQNLPFPLISDSSKEILKAYGAWGMKSNYGKTYEGIIRSTYIIDENGVIMEVIAKVDTKNHSEQILKLIEQ